MNPIKQKRLKICLKGKIDSKKFFKFFFFKNFELILNLLSIRIEFFF